MGKRTQRGFIEEAPRHALDTRDALRHPRDSAAPDALGETATLQQFRASGGLEGSSVERH